MKRDIKNDGLYVEVGTSEVIDKIEELKRAEIVTVVTPVRIELAGEDKVKFVELFESWLKCIGETNPQFSSPEMSNEQRSDIIFRQMLIGSGNKCV